MARRLLVGLVIGLVVGGIFAFALIRGLQMTSFDVGGGAVLAYLFAALTGAVTGLVAGKPIWSSGAQVEAALKAVFGGLLAAGLMFVLRKWVNVDVNLTAIGAGGGHLGSLPGASLPLVAAVLGGFFGLDNTGGDEKDDKKDGAKDGKAKAATRSDPRAEATSKSRARVEAESANGEEDERGAASKRAKR